MSLDSTNFGRNTRTDESRIHFWQKKPSLGKIFTAKEFHTFLSFLNKRWKSVFCLAVLAFLLGGIEGLKAATIIGMIKGVVASSEQLKELLDFSLMGESWVVTDWFSIEPRVILVGGMVIALTVLTLLTAGGKLISQVLTAKVQMGIVRDVRQKSLNKIFSFDIEYFNQARSGELLFLMNTETSRFTSIITLAVQFLSFGVQLLIFVGFLLYFFWDLTLLLLTVVVVFFLLHLQLDLRIKIKSWETNRVQNSLSQFFHQAVYGIKIIKIAGLEEREKERYLREHLNYEHKSIQAALFAGGSEASQHVLVAVALLVVMGGIYWLKDFHNLLQAPDQILAYLFLLVRAIPAGLGLQNIRTALIGKYGPLSRVMALHHQPDGPDKEEPQDRTGMPAVKKLNLRDLEFSYGEHSVLKNINLDFHQGQQIALVGFSGSGKSTLLDIIAGLRQTQSGKILLDGKILNQENLRAYKQVLGYMNQEPIIFHDTIHMNVTYFNPKATETEIWRALKIAGAEDFVKELPDGLNTGLGERGQTVSGGQRQRIGLARIFLQNPKILLLDEATNALDYETEKLIYDNLAKLKEGRVLIVAAHRLSAIRDFDHIVVLSHGKLVEQGTHKQLMGSQGLYYNLYSVQEQEK
jgi:ATP-binding cassette, subfamily B, bacterial MsbA